VFNGAISAVSGAFNGLKDTVMGIFDAILEAARAVANAVSNLTGGGGGGNQGGAGHWRGGEIHAARGGFVHGSGTSTSDSIRAWLSNGEFVQNAKAVRKYGTDFMHALNQQLIPIEAIRALMQGFNMGGLVQSLGALMPRTQFADGGLVSASLAGGSRPVNINIGGETFAMSASDDVVDRLQRFASAKSIRSAGRKPSWFQG
jgi:hypothetical protein